MRRAGAWVPVLALLLLVASSLTAAQPAIRVTIGPGRDEAAGAGTAAAPSQVPVRLPATGDLSGLGGVAMLLSADLGGAGFAIRGDWGQADNRE